MTRSSQSNMTTKTLIPFLAITFGLTWGLAIIFVLFTDQIVAVFGELSISNPLFILAVYSPGFASAFLVWRQYGFKGLVSFFRRLTLWRVSRWWWLFIILGIPAIMYAGAAVKGAINAPFPFSPWYQVLPALALTLFLGPIEEFGWRGLALPLLQRKFAPFWAGLILGIIWSVWHTPAFLIGGTPQSAWSFAPYFAGTTAVSVILTALFNDSRGSLLTAVLVHFQLNNPIWPDAQPWDNLLLITAAVIIVWLNRRTMFRHGSGVTDILMPEQGVLG
ncbi:MAG: CPBP family intramembrane metalloprotease [Anaerolineales bacterium]|nr:CPBP family intramembrane metalloprotease [Anaerolineales bacterium]